MKSFKFMYLMLFFIFSAVGYADNNNINGSCPGEIISEIDGTQADASHTENGGIGGGGNDRYRMTFPVAGTFDISASNTDASRNANYRFYISRNNCGNNNAAWNIENSYNGTSPSFRVNVNAGDTIYIRLQSNKNLANKGKHRYALRLDFTAAPSTSTTVWVPNATGTSASLSPSPYTNNADDTETLSIAGATELEVTITGDIEFHNTCGFDYVTITPDAGHGKYCGNGINDTFTVNAGSISLAFHSDTSDVENGVTVTIVAVPGVAPIMNAIPPQTIPINSVGNTVNLSTFVTLTNGDPILSYTLGGSLPPGMSFDNGTGIISGTPTTVGNSNLTVYATDKDGDSNIVSFSIRIVPPNRVNNGYSDFTLRYQSTIVGKLLTVGNTILVAPKPITSITLSDGTIEQSNTANCNVYTDGEYIDSATSANNNYTLCAYHSDTNVLFSTTRAQLPIPATGSEIKWAGLYWQSIVDNNASASLTSMQLQLKHEATKDYTSAPYQTVDYDTLNFNVDGGQSGYTSYSAFADVTSYFRDNNLTGGYLTVGDIPTFEGTIPWLGTYGAWTLVIVYKDDTEKLQNFSIYDGWKKVSRDVNNTNVDIDVSGFYTPKQPANKPPITINSNVSVFTAEGDKYIYNDYLKAKASKRTSFTTLTHTTSGQTFNSAIVTSTSFDRTPNPSNNLGIDIQEFNIGTNGEDLLEPEESSIKFEFSSNQDTYWPSMIAFATELYVPDICYDYTVRLGEYVRIPSDDRDINTRLFNNLPVNIQFSLRSEEADFIYFDTKARIEFTGTGSSRFSYNRDYAEMSPPTINTYYKIADGYTEIEANASIGQIAIGANVIGVNPNNGGTISPEETTYAVLGYDISGEEENISAHFDFIFNAKIRFEPGATPVDYEFNTASSPGSSSFIPRCPVNEIYDPLYMQFNVERVAAENEPRSTKYTLHTQVTQRPYQLAITSYQDSNRSSGAHIPITFDGTVEIEWIDAGGFQNSHDAGYDMVCEEPKSVGKGSLISFNANNTESRHTINIPADTPEYNDKRALKEAALRLWIISVPESNGTRRIISHRCTDKTNSNSCFTRVYTTQIDTNGTGSCTSECSGTNSACYDCLKINYAFPVCSRDNFAVRPASYKIKVSDDGDKVPASSPQLIGDNKSLTPLRLAAEYKYVLEINATNFNNDNIAQKYFLYEFNVGNYVTLPSPILDSGALAPIEFNDAGPCYDKNNTTLGISFYAGMLAKPTKLDYPNVGNYKFWLVDSNWTAVDQASSGIKPMFEGVLVDDCQIGSAENTTGTKAGCTIYSNSGNKKILNLNFQPYQFHVGVPLTTTPVGDYLFLNDFTHSYYNDTTLHPVDMGAVFDGNITAQGKQGGTLTNFTNGCAASDVRINASITATTAETLPLQLYLSSKAGDYKSTTTLGTKTDLTLGQVAFDHTIDQGIAKMQLYSTLKKPLKLSPLSPLPEVNPIVISYEDLNATGDSATSRAEMATITPAGVANYDRNITFVYGKIVPEKRIYNNVTEKFRTTKLYVDIYCDATVICTDYNLTTSMTGLAEGESAFWYLAPNARFNATNIGTTTLTTTTYAGADANPKVSIGATLTRGVFPIDDVIDDVPFDNAAVARQEDINVSISGSARPSVVKIKYDPVPWLDYDNSTDTTSKPNNDSDYYRVKFIGERGWAGVGSTGEVSNTTSSSETRPRMNW